MNTWLKAVAAAAILAVAYPAIPASAEEREDDEGIPAYSVARLRIFKGNVWVRTPDSGEWEEFATNSPIPERARVSVPAESEAELQFHGGQGVLLSAGSEIDVRQLGVERSSFGLRAGEIRFDLPDADFAPVRVRIPGGGNAAFAVPGRYWLTARDDGETRLVVRTGQATVSKDRGDVTVKAGEEAMIGADVRVGRFGGSAGTEEVPQPLSEAESEAGVPPYAADELRDYGEWVESDEYGYVWRPRVAVGWSPYYYGHWNWVSPYGWVWVSFEPWGWWPYHFGYWYSDPFFGWVWSPYRSFVSVNFTFGSFRTRHFLSRCYFAPATVRFTRDGRNVRWVPLRPGERGSRIAFTRADSRLAGWERPLPRGTVLVRQGKEGGRVWRDYSAARGERRPIVREESAGRAAARGSRDVRRGGQGRPPGDTRLRGGEARPGLERPRGTGRVTPSRRPDVAPRPERMNRENRPPQGGRGTGIERRDDRGFRGGGMERRDGGGVRGGRMERRDGGGVRGGRMERGVDGGVRVGGMERRDGGRGGSFSLPRMLGGSGGGRDRGGGRDLTGFGARDGGDWRGGRGGR